MKAEKVFVLSQGGKNMKSRNVHKNNEWLIVCIYIGLFIFGVSGYSYGIKFAALGFYIMSIMGFLEVTSRPSEEIMAYNKKEANLDQMVGSMTLWLLIFLSGRKGIRNVIFVLFLYVALYQILFIRPKHKVRELKLLLCVGTGILPGFLLMVIVFNNPLIKISISLLTSLIAIVAMIRLFMEINEGIKRCMDEL